MSVVISGVKSVVSLCFAFVSRSSFCFVLELDSSIARLVCFLLELNSFNRVNGKPDSYCSSGTGNGTEL